MEVSESRYYGWRKRKSREPGRRQKADEQLTSQVVEVFEQSHQTYGSPRIHAALRSKGVSCSRRRVAKLMRRLHSSLVVHPVSNCQFSLKPKSQVCD